MKKIIALISAFVLIFGMGAYSMANADEGQTKVGVCHRTAAETNPYVYIEVPADEANGHVTGTDKQHNLKVTWNEDGTWRGVAHVAGDERIDYLAGSASECEDTTPTVEPTPPVITEPPLVNEPPKADNPKDKPQPKTVTPDEVVIPTVVHAGL